MMPADLVVIKLATCWRARGERARRRPTASDQLVQIPFVVSFLLAPILNAFLSLPTDIFVPI